MSAAEDWELSRRARKKSDTYGLGQAAARGLERPVIITHCQECGAVIPYDENCNLCCTECWNRINGRK